MSRQKKQLSQPSLPNLDITKQELSPNRRFGLVSIQIDELGKLKDIMKSSVEAQKMDKRMRRADKLKALVLRNTIANREQVLFLPSLMPELKPQFSSKIGRKLLVDNFESPKMQGFPRHKNSKSFFTIPKASESEYKIIKEKFNNIDHLMHNSLLRRNFSLGSGELLFYLNGKRSIEEILAEKKFESIIAKPNEDKTKFKKLTYIDKINLKKEQEESTKCKPVFESQYIFR